VVVAATFLVDSESRLKSSAPVRAPARPAVSPAGRSGHVTAGKTVIDPNCGMPVDPAKAAASGYTLAYHGSTHYFCSEKCKEKYQHSSAVTASKQVSGR
jgi:YHS domain-containing protein